MDGRADSLAAISAKDLDKLQTHFQRLWVPVICHKVHNTLPQEVRDMIYSELFNDDWDPRATPLYDADKQDRLERGGLQPTSHGLEVFNRPYFDEAIVGSAVARDVAAAWYKHISFNSDIFGAIDLNEFLNFDRWGLGLSPFKLIRHVSLALDELLLDNPIFNSLHRLHTFQTLHRHVSLHISILADTSPRDSLCLGCREIIYRCRGEYQCFLARSTRMIMQLVNGLERLIVAIRTLRQTHPFISVSFQHYSVTVVLYDHAENLSLSLETWVQRLQDEKERLRERARLDCEQLESNDSGRYGNDDDSSGDRVSLVGGIHGADQRRRKLRMFVSIAY